MNLHGYKCVYKRIKDAYKYETSKPQEKQNEYKIGRLIISMRNCRKTIHKLKKYEQVFCVNGKGKTIPKKVRIHGRRRKH